MNNTQYQKIKLSEFIKILNDEYNKFGDKEVYFDLDDHFFYIKEIENNEYGNWIYIYLE